MNTNVRKIPIEDFISLPEEVNFQMSFDGEYIAYLKQYKKRLNIHIRDLNKNEDIRITNSEDRDIIRYRWANDNRIIYLKDERGDENYKLYAVNIDGTDFKTLTPFEGVKTFFLDELSNNKEEILVTINKRDRRFFDVYKVNIYTGEMTEVIKTTSGFPVWIVDHDENIRAGFEINGATTKILYRDSIEEEFRVVFEGNNKENIKLLGFTEDNRSLVVASNVGRDKYAIYVFNPMTKEHAKLLYENDFVDVEEVLLSKKSKKVLAAIYTSDKLNYHFMDKSIENIYLKLKSKFTRECMVFESMNKVEDKLLIRVFSDKNPGVYYLYDVKNDELKEIGKVRPCINEEEMAEMKPIKYTSRDGLTIHGYLTIPKVIEPQNIPVVVNPHGGPTARDSWVFRAEAQFLANRGYAVLSVNFRNSIGYGRKFKEAGFKQWGKAVQNDITDGVNWLIEEGIADKDRIGIYGGSFGGYATLAGLTFTPDLYACGVDLVGPSNLFTMLESLIGYWEPHRKMLSEMTGDPEEDEELLREISPLFHVENIKKPLFVIQGANDVRVPQREAEQIVGALRARGQDVKYMLKEDEGHGFMKYENRIEMFKEIEKFFEQYLR